MTMPRFTYVAEMFAANAESFSDCLPCFYGTVTDAIELACDEIARVNAIPIEERDCGLDWAQSFQIRRYDNFASLDDRGEIVVARRGLNGALPE